jgi:Tol biopolymer transport system component
VAFHSWRTGNRDVFVQPLDGRPIQQVTRTARQEVVPRWSPDGTAIGYAEFIVDSGARGAVWVSRRSPAGGWSDPAQLIDWGSWPIWSPDGRTIAYTQAFQSPTISLMPADSGLPRLLYDARSGGGPTVEEMVWSADSRSLYFKSHAATGEASIWAIDVAGGPPRLLVSFDLERPSGRFRIAASATNLYFSIEEQRSDVGVIELEASDAR